MNGKLRWLGLAFFEYIASDGRVVLYDPWTKTDGNPFCEIETSEIKKADLVLVSHDHLDHVGSAADICKQTGAMLGAADETTKRLISEEGMSVSQVVNGGCGYLVGGTAMLPWVKIIATPALHTSKTSTATGTISKFADGTSIYHTGDTCVIAEMEIYSRLYGVDIVLLPLMPRCTMDVVQAVEAVRMIKPKIAMPMHYDFPDTPKDIVSEFMSLCNKVNPQVRVVVAEKNKYYSLESLF